MEKDKAKTKALKYCLLKDMELFNPEQRLRVLVESKGTVEVDHNTPPIRYIE